MRTPKGLTIDMMTRIIKESILRENEKDVLIKRLQGKSLSEIALGYSKSAERIRQIESRGCRRMYRIFRMIITSALISCRLG